MFSASYQPNYLEDCNYGCQFYTLPRWKDRTLNKSICLIPDNFLLNNLVLAVFNGGLLDFLRYRMGFLVIAYGAFNPMAGW